MNGSEVVSKPPYDQSLELSDSEKMDLMAGDSTPYATAIKKLMKLEVLKARDEAMDCDPADKDRQHVLMTIAHAKSDFCKQLTSAILFEKTSHLADVKQKALEEELKDQKKMDEVILYNQTH